MGERIARPSLSQPASLNDAQMRAVNHLHGPSLVLAGAGSGKTRVIVHKIARLLGRGPGAELGAAQIAAITFTNKAAAEMRERAKALIGARAAKDLLICTFHALGVRMLREDGAAIGLKKNFSILDSDDVLSLMRDAGGSTDNATARRWQWTISLWKNQGLDPACAEAQAKDADEVQAARVMTRYQERLAAYQAVDFNDLIGLPAALLARDEAVRTKWQQRLRHVLVDEYQDTNAQQYELLKLLVGDGTTRPALFTAVGDDDQSIYGWRGATIDNLKRLPQDYPALAVIPLEQNYRSTGHILRAANRVIAANPKLFDKKLWSDFGDGEPVRVVEADSEDHEAERAVARVQALREAGGHALDWKDFAILYRANHQARVFEQKLRAAQIPYKVSGGQSYFDRAEIKDLCAWLRLLVNQDDDPAFLRAVTTPKRGIGHQTLTALGSFASTWKVSLYEALFAEALAGSVNAKALGSLHEFGRCVNELEYRARQTTGADDARALLLGWLEDIGYEQHLHDGEDSEKLAAARWANVLDFVDWIAKRCGGRFGDDGVEDLGTFETERKSVLEVAQTIAVILSLAERGDDPNVLTLSTLHAAKGLEWPHVQLVGINEGLLPFKADDDSLPAEVLAARIEEERRLMYVGITRARQTLGVSWLRRRKRGRETVPGQPSRFIAEMAPAAGEEPAVDPKEKLRALRARLQSRVDAAAPASQP